MIRILQSLLIIARFSMPAQVLCTLGGAPSSYNEYLDQRPTTDAIELGGNVIAALDSACRPNCPGLAMFRNSTAPNLMLTAATGSLKIVYKPEFFTTVYESYGDGGILAVLAHEAGHAIDATAAPPSWIKSNWTPELRADAWAGCVLATTKLSGSALKASLSTLAKYPSAAHPAWEDRVPVLRIGYTQCGGDPSVWNKALQR